MIQKINFIILSDKGVKFHQRYIFIARLEILLKKLLTCEESETHRGISFWHLLMNLKNNYLFKKLLKWANKKCKNFNIYNVLFFKKWRKYLEISLFYNCVPNFDDMIYSSLDVTDVTNFKCNRLNLVIMGLWVIFFLPLLKTRKTRILKKWKMKKIAGDIILHLFNKNHNHMRYDSWDKKRHDKIICHFGPFFTFLPP